MTNFICGCVSLYEFSILLAQSETEKTKAKAFPFILEMQVFQGGKNISKGKTALVLSHIEGDGVHLISCELPYT